MSIKSQRRRNKALYLKLSAQNLAIIICFSLTPLLWAAGLEENYQKGLQSFQEKNYEEAVKSFQDIIEKDPSHYPSLYNLGLAFACQGQWKEALLNFQKAKEFNPYDLTLNPLLADLYLMKEQNNEASKIVKETLKTNFQDIGAHLKSGILELEAAKPQEALEEFIFVKNLRPQNTTALLCLGISYVKTSQMQKAGERLEVLDPTTLTAEYSSVYFYLKGLLLQQEEKTEEAKQAWQTAGDKNADLKQHLEKGSDCETILAYLVSLLKMALAKEEVASAQPVEEFNPPEVVKRLAERLKKEEPIVVKPTPSQEGAKRPYNLKGEFEQTFEYYDRSPKASSPINMLNTTSRLKVTGSQQPYSFESEWEWYYDRWDHTHLDWYKVNITSPNTSWDIGKFSSRYFPNLVSHPSIEDGVRLWHKFEKPAFEPKLENPLPQLPEGQEAQEVKSEESTPLNIARLYEDSFTDDRTFKSAELTVVSGRSKKPINLNHRKEKNEDTYETSGQYEQWVVASRLLTRPTDTTEANAAWSYVADDPDSATTSSTTLPIKSQAVGMDGKWELLDRKLNLDGEFAFSDYDTDMEDKSNKHLRDFAWMWGTDYKPASNWTMSYDEKRIGHNFKVEGAYQTEDKITHTFTTKYTPSKSQPWSIRSFDLKLEPARTNLNGGSDQTKYYNTAQPKISFTLPQDTKLSFDYKNYQEHWASCCTNYRTNTLATDLDYEYKPWKLTFKPGYTFERKDDRVASPTDEKMKNFRIAFEDRLIERLVLKYSISFEVKEYVGFTTKSYREHKYSFEAGYTLIPGRSTLTIKTSRDDKDPTDTNETILDTYGVDIDFTSKDGNQKFVFAYERKLNIYEPWLDTSAYRQHYMKLKFTSKF